jgi:uncharacterized protein (TIGR02722 family)
MKMKKISLLLVVLATSCQPKMKAQRMTIDEGDKKAMNITNEWVVTDTNLAVKSIVDKINNQGRFRRYMGGYVARAPKMFVGIIENRTSEDNFPIEALNNKLLSVLFENGDFDLISAKDRDRILKEINYQNSGMVRASDIKSVGKASGADLMLNGEVIMEAKTLSGQTIKEYSIAIRLVDIESGEEVARVSYDTTKYSKQKKIGW